MPLQLAFPRPAAGRLDRRRSSTRSTASIVPYNMFPSLHIAIWMILAGTYDRHTRGGVRVLTHGWFGLIGVVHRADVSAPRDRRRRRSSPSRCLLLLRARRGSYTARQPVDHQSPRRRCSTRPPRRCSRGSAHGSGRGAGRCSGPRVSLAIVAGAYFGLYAGIARKQRTAAVAAAPRTNHSGAVAVRSTSVAASTTAGTAVPWNEVVPNVWIGRRLNDREAATAVRQGVTAVLDLTGECSEAGPFLTLEYLNLQVLDLTAPTPQQLRAAADFINTHRETGTVYVHCKIGYSRSAASVGAWLLDAGLAATAEEAVALLRAARPTLVVRPEAWVALREFQRSIEVRLKPDTTGVQVRLKPDATGVQVHRSSGPQAGRHRMPVTHETTDRRCLPTGGAAASGEPRPADLSAGRGLADRPRRLGQRRVSLQHRLCRAGVAAVSWGRPGRMAAVSGCCSFWRLSSSRPACWRISSTAWSRWARDRRRRKGSSTTKFRIASPMRSS